MEEGERWLPVVSFEGRYEVSSFGSVRSLDRLVPYVRIDQYSGRLLAIKKRMRGRMLRPGPSNSGHLSVVLGRGHTMMVHFLVLSAFVGPRPPGLESLHDDGNPANNRLDNLRWGTRSENVFDAIRHGTYPLGERKHNAKLTDGDIPEIRRLIKSQSILSVAERFGVNEVTIRQVRDGRTWKHIGGGDAHQNH